MRILLTIALTALVTPQIAGAQRMCDGVIDGTELRIRLRSYTTESMPFGDLVAYPAADAVVTCRIDASGGLSDCVSSVSGRQGGTTRGEWLVRQVRFWKVLDRRFGGCPVAGRQLELRFRFLENDRGLSFRKGARWELPLNL